MERTAHEPTGSLQAIGFETEGPEQGQGLDAGGRDHSAELAKPRLPLSLCDQRLY